MIPARRGEVKKRSVIPPRMVARFRSAIEMFTLTAFWRTVVSDARRDWSSPVRRESKNAIS
jgi:hypothetical protein